MLSIFNCYIANNKNHCNAKNSYKKLPKPNNKKKKIIQFSISLYVLHSFIFCFLENCTSIQILQLLMLHNLHENVVCSFYSLFYFYLNLNRVRSTFLFCFIVDCICFCFHLIDYTHTRTCAKKSSVLYGHEMVNSIYRVRRYKNEKKTV